MGLSDPSDNHIDFDDPVAQKTKWTGLLRKGNMFRSARLVRTGPDSVEFRTIAGTRIVNVVCILIGLFFILGGYAAFWMALMGLGLVALGISQLVSGRKPLVLDKDGGYFSKGRLQYGPSEAGILAKLADVHALQLISVLVTDHDSEGTNYYQWYELNLVLHGGERVNVISHADWNRILTDARTLAEFLEVPLWDATNQ